MLKGQFTSLGGASADCIGAESHVVQPHLLLLVGKEVDDAMSCTIL